MHTSIMAHFTDTHLGQRLVTSEDMVGDKMRYEDAPGEHETHLRRVLDDITARNISAVVFGGDIGRSDDVEKFFEILAEYAFSASIVLGNHDDLRDVSRFWKAGFASVEGKMCSARDDGPVKHIVLDSSANAIGDHQRAWLARELAGTAKAVLFMHHPILAIATPLERSGAALGDRRELTALLTSTDCEISVFCGHYHMADDADEANIRQYATPAVSYQIVKESDRIEVDTRTFGYRVLEICPTRVDTEIVLFKDAS